MSNNRTFPKTAVVIVGMAGSGKSTLASFLRQHHWPIAHFGTITMEEVKRRGLPAGEASERAVREELRRQHGMAAFAALSLPGIRESLGSHRRVAIDGLYSWAEYRHLRDHLEANLLVIAIFTPRKTRYRRLSGRPERPLTTEEVESRDFAEIERLEKGGPIAIADYTLMNSGSVVDLERQFQQVLEAEGVWEKG